MNYNTFKKECNRYSISSKSLSKEEFDNLIKKYPNITYSVLTDIACDISCGFSFDVAVAANTFNLDKETTS